MRLSTSFRLALALAFAPAAALAAGGLGGSMQSMEGQHAVAVESDYSFLRRPQDVARLVELGRLVSVEGNADYSLSKVSFPYTRPEVLAFIERLAREYRAEFGSKLVVTSLTRPRVKQPRNAHELSVHPAGMAVDLRIPWATAARTWLEKTLLDLEDEEAIDVTREKNPPHYHVAVFGAKYLPVAARLDSAWAEREALAAAKEAARVQAQADSLAAAQVAAERDAGGSRAGLLLAGATVLLLGAPVVRRHRRRTDSKEI